MPTIANVSFNVKFDLTGVPSLVLTDTTSSAPTGLVGIFEITQPDKYTRSGDINSPDVSSAGDDFTYPLRLDSLGKTQCGTYTIKYTANAPGYLSTDFTRTFVFQYVASELVLTEDFDVFTPELRYLDDTVYAQSGYTNSSVSRSWSAISTPTGTITGTAQIFDMKYNTKYYSAVYSVSLTSALTYTSTTYPWLTIQESLSGTASSCAGVPPGVEEIIQQISDIKLEYDNSVNACKERVDLKAQFEWAETLFQHIIDRVSIGDTDNISNDLFDLIKVLNNNQYVCNPTNAIIPPYDINQLISSAIWGYIVGDITQQTDLMLLLAQKQGNITLTTIGESGPATFNPTTSVLNIPNYQGGVTSFNTRTGAITLTNGDVVSALGFTPENVANKSTSTSLGTSDTLYPTQNAVKVYVDSQVAGATIPDATATVKGKLKLTGDLGGTADSPTVPDLANKEPLISAGTTSQYWRGDKSWQTLDKSAVGLSNVDNTSDADKPISDDTQDALDLKEDVANKSTDVNLGTSDTLYPSQKAVKEYVDGKLVTNIRSVQTFNATAGQTSFTISGGYTVGQVDVFINGDRQTSSEYTATNGTSISFTSGLVLNDVVDVVIYTVSTGLTGTMTVSTSGFGENISYNPITDVLVIDKYNWMDLARGYTVEPTLFSSSASAEVYEYVYTTSTFYRNIKTDGTEDAFYSDSALTIKLCDKKIII